MKGIEYKVVPAPRRARSVRGVKGKAEQFARNLQDIITEEARGGWEYVRADLIPCEEKPGFFSRRQEIHRAMLVFRKLPPAPAPTVMAAAPEPARGPRFDPVERPARQPQPQPQPQQAQPEPEEEPFELRSSQSHPSEPARRTEPAPMPFRPLGSAND